MMLLWFHGRKDVLLGDSVKSEILQPKIIFTLFNNIEKNNKKTNINITAENSKHIVMNFFPPDNRLFLNLKIN